MAESPELKRGEFKKLLIERMEVKLPDFEFDQYKNSAYHFKRIRNFGRYPIYEDLHINFSLKEEVICCSLSSNFNPTYRFTSNYQTGVLSNHLDLLELKHGAGIASLDEPAFSYYSHNGRVSSVAKAMALFIDDYSSVGMDFLESRLNSFSSNELLRFGLEFMDKTSANTEQLKKEFEAQLKAVEYVTSRIKHPMYIELKEKLQSIPNQTKELRQQIPKLAFSLIEMYYDNNGM